MRVTDLLSGPARMDDSAKTLRVRWEETKEQWRDPVCLEFEQNYLEELEHQVLGTLERMRALASTMTAAVQECS